MSKLKTQVVEGKESASARYLTAVGLVLIYLQAKSKPKSVTWFEGGQSLGAQWPAQDFILGDKFNYMLAGHSLCYE